MSNMLIDFFESQERYEDCGYLLKIKDKIISNEDKKQPLSDSDISKSFNDNGIKIARRTIAKYREVLSIPISKYRKLK